MKLPAADQEFLERSGIPHRVFEEDGMLNVELLDFPLPPGLNATTANIVADLKGMRIEEIGRHRIEVRSGDQILGSSPFLVNLVLRQAAGNA